MGNASSSTSTSISSGNASLKYEPRTDLRGHLRLEEPIDDDDHDGEVIVATFKFEACEWERPSWSNKEKPIPVGMVEGLGHVTTQRLVLFWDVKSALSSEMIGAGGDVISHVAEWKHHKILSDFVGALSKIGSRSRTLMEKQAQQYAPHGIASWYFPDGSDADEFLAKTEDGIYFVVLDQKLGPVSGLTFRPDYLESGWSADYRSADFEKILNQKVGVKSRRADGIKRGLDSLVYEYWSG